MSKSLIRAAGSAAAFEFLRPCTNREVEMASNTAAEWANKGAELGARHLGKAGAVVGGAVGGAAGAARGIAGAGSSDIDPSDAHPRSKRGR